ncbi:alpha/beta-hydrolase [Phellopilus nigrolimitatus]|nr:alpha/beta-hydrolase [Phellopilus nigrolimitatus]
MDCDFYFSFSEIYLFLRLSPLACSKAYAVLLLSLYCILSSSRRGPRFLWIRPLNRALQRFAPWQLIAATFSALYAFRNFDRLLGLDAPDHTGQLYARDYSRAAWVVTGLDAGFATAMSIRPKWLRDICSMLFSVYYLCNGDEAESKIHRLRELCTLEVLRVTWDKTSNPYLRALSAPYRPSVPIRRLVSFPRPKHSSYTRPVDAWLFFSGSEEELRQTTELVLDFPGGGFVAMGPTHHEERLRAWAKRLRRPVLSVDYGKAPEFPYPYAIEEGFDLYCTLAESSGRILGMSGVQFSAILSGDSAGGNIAVNVMFKILEASAPGSSLSTLSIPRPAGLALTYAALSFSFASWAWPSSPTPSPSSLSLDTATGISKSSNNASSSLSTSSTLFPSAKVILGSLAEEKKKNGTGSMDGEDVEYEAGTAEQWTPSKTVVYQQAHTSLFERQQVMRKALKPVVTRTPSVMTRLSQMAGARMTMSSKAGYMHDPIITPSMMWAMCLLYLGPRFAPGVERDHRLSPLFAPADALAALPPLLLQCGARDPLVDDTVLFGARVRAAKRAAAKMRTGTEDVDADAACLATPPVDGVDALDATGGRLEQAEGAGADDVVDDVTVQIFPGWSHGYLQMSALMRGAHVAIDDIADWMGGTFERGQTPARA